MTPRASRRYTPPRRALVSMSNGLDVDQHVAEHLRAHGCTCRYRLEVDRDAVAAGELVHATVHHDDDCPLWKRARRHAN